MPTNERLRGSILSVGLHSADVAERIGVDPKTVERWITQGRLPHRSHRVAVAGVLKVDEAYLWPEIVNSKATQSASAAELLQLHPTRSAVPHDTWRRLIDGAREAMDILVYAGTFLIEQHSLAEVLHQKSAAGVRCRILIGDETSPNVRIRAEEEGTPGGLEGRIQLNRRYLRDAVGLPGIEVRIHGTTLYNSLFRFDEDLLVNGHVFGSPAGFSPTLHLRRVPGGRMWDHYMRSFDDVWALGTPEVPTGAAATEKAG